MTVWQCRLSVKVEVGQSGDPIRQGRFPVPSLGRRVRGVMDLHFTWAWFGEMNRSAGRRYDSKSPLLWNGHAVAAYPLLLHCAEKGADLDPGKLAHLSLRHKQRSSSIWMTTTSLPGCRVSSAFFCTCTSTTTRDYDKELERDTVQWRRHFLSLSLQSDHYVLAVEHGSKNDTARYLGLGHVGVTVWDTVALLARIGMRTNCNGASRRGRILVISTR